MTAIAVLFMLLATYFAFVALYHSARAATLQEWQEGHCQAAEQLVEHCEQLEKYAGHLEAVNRHNREIVAGSMMVMLALDVEERLWVADGERNVP